MLELIASDTFAAWISGLRDRTGREVVFARLARLRAGLFGDVKSVGDGVSEMRIPYGPGYRIYFMRRGSAVIVLLAGGDKSSQRRDIAAAKRIAADWKG